MIWVEVAGWMVLVVSVAGVLLNNARNRWCFVLWWASNIASAALHAHAGMWGLTVRDAVFFALAVVGWVQWGRKTNAGTVGQGGTQT